VRPIAGKPGSHRDSADLKVARYLWEPGLPAMGCAAAPNGPDAQIAPLPKPLKHLLAFKTAGF